MSKYIVFLMFFCMANAFAQEVPNPMVTPGKVRTTDLNIICGTSAKEFRKTTESMKSQVYKSYGLVGDHTGYCDTSDEGCEIDHLVSLELGGADDVANLWPQSYAKSYKWNAHVKDKLENELHEKVCNNTMDIKEAQSAIIADWKSLYVKIFGNEP